MWRMRWAWLTTRTLAVRGEGLASRRARTMATPYFKVSDVLAKEEADELATLTR
jgi:hypothetical protein